MADEYVTYEITGDEAVFEAKSTIAELMSSVGLERAAVVFISDGEGGFAALVNGAIPLAGNLPIGTPCDPRNDQCRPGTKCRCIRRGSDEICLCMR